jgi:hypothetical protein
MDSSKDIWHFARPVLAKQYLGEFDLGEFDLGLISARALFANRRMGKSTFLERDLIPAAKKAGYITPYLNLWTATRTPAQALVRVVSAAVAPKGWPRVLKRLKGVKSVKTSAAATWHMQARARPQLWRTPEAKSTNLAEFTTPRPRGFAADRTRHHGCLFGHDTRSAGQRHGRTGPEHRRRAEGPWPTDAQRDPGACGARRVPRSG